MKKEILRKCIITQEVCNRNKLFRVVKTPLNIVKLDLSYKENGRGAYILKDKDVILKAKNKGILARNLEISIPEEIYEEMLNNL